MDPDSLLKPILSSLKDTIRNWKPPASSRKASKRKRKRKGEEDGPSLTENMREIAARLKVSDKTVSNWVNSPVDHPITLRRLCEVCIELGMSPSLLLPDFPQIEPIEKISNPVEAERRLLELESGIANGGMKLVVFPLWSSPLFLDPLNLVYATKGLYKRFISGEDGSEAARKDFFGEAARRKDFLDLRHERRRVFETGNYTLRSLFMRDEFDNYVNKRRLFRRCERSQIVEQIDHIMEFVSAKTWDQRPRLEMRLTKSFFRNQYGIFIRPDGADTLVLNTNSGYVMLRDTKTQEFLKQEFHLLWEEGTYEGLRTSQEWLAFLGIMRDKVEAGRKRDDARGREKDRRSGSRDRRTIDTKAFLEPPAPKRD